MRQSVEFEGFGFKSTSHEIAFSERSAIEIEIHGRNSQPQKHPALMILFHENHLSCASIALKKSLSWLGG
jgi:hypothetical protein